MLRRVFKAFHYRDFRLLWIGACTSSIGTWMQQVAQAWLIFTMTGSASLLSLDAFLGAAPFLMFSLFGGVFAIFGHGNVAGLGEALYQYRDKLPTYRAHNEQAMANAAIAYAKAHFRRRMMACSKACRPTTPPTCCAS